MSLRFSSSAASALRRAIREAGGVEVFAIGDVEGGRVAALTVAARGREDRVTALLDRPRAGQVVIHNHPSGDLRPSDADLRMAGRYGDDGVGVVIVDSEVARDNWVVEPHTRVRAPVDRQALDRFFRQGLTSALSDAEIRQEQLDMATDVARCLDDEGPLVVEAGTGTGKSLAYLAPAALWALANDAKVVVSTYTRALQAQLSSKDLPLLVQGGIDVRYAVLQGRNNYVCKRRLAIADAEDSDQRDRGELDALIDWESTSASGARDDLPLRISPALWERVESDTDLTLRVRCPHYATCRYYTARREAAGAHVVVVNHALLLADLALRDAGGPGLLPKYERLVIDEAHHLEDAATGAIARRLTLRGLQRPVATLVGSRGKRGALQRLVSAHSGDGSALPPADRDRLEVAAALAKQRLDALRQGGKAVLEALADNVLGPDRRPLRVRAEDQDGPLWERAISPALSGLDSLLTAANGALDRLLAPFDDLPLPRDRAQPVLDVRRARRRLGDRADTLRSWARLGDDECRWIEPSRGRGNVSAVLWLAPVEVAAVLRRLLWDKVPATVSTSATLTVARRFDHWMSRTGLPDASAALYASPFDHARQALLGLPRDLPQPNHPEFLARSAHTLVEAVTCSGGGAFVLCTSYEAVRHYAAVLRDALPDAMPVLEQRTAGRAALLERFRGNPDAVLVGTDSFWEGVSVKGHGLRLVVIPRLPFRVPTDPLEQARHELISRQGGDPFRAYTLPQAVIKLRQGYGRLIRSRTDTGAVLLMDRRVHDRSYGRIVLHSLPPARRVTGPWRRVREALERFYAPGVVVP